MSACTKTNNKLQTKCVPKKTFKYITYVNFNILFCLKRSQYFCHRNRVTIIIIN